MGILSGLTKSTEHPNGHTLCIWGLPAPPKMRLQQVKPTTIWQSAQAAEMDTRQWNSGFWAPPPSKTCKGSLTGATSSSQSCPHPPSTPSGAWHAHVAIQPSASPGRGCGRFRPQTLGSPNFLYWKQDVGIAVTGTAFISLATPHLHR